MPVAKILVAFSSLGISEDEDVSRMICGRMLFGLLRLSVEDSEMTEES